MFTEKDRRAVYALRRIGIWPSVLSSIYDAPVRRITGLDKAVRLFDEYNEDPQAFILSCFTPDRLSEIIAHQNRVQLNSTKRPFVPKLDQATYVQIMKGTTNGR